MKYKAILFDMDGVLVLSEPLHYKAWLLTIDEINKDYTLPEKEVIGLTDAFVARNVALQTKTQTTAEELLVMKRNHFLQLMKNGIPAVEGRNEFLTSYGEQAAMAVVSSSNRQEIDAILSGSGIAGFFKFFIGYEDTEMHKPLPDPYLKAMRMLDCAPDQTLIIEDSPAGVEAAIKSEADVVCLNTSNLLNDAQRTPLFSNFQEVSAWIDARR